VKSPTKIPKLNFFSLRTRLAESFKSLNSSLAQLTSKLRSCKVVQKYGIYILQGFQHISNHFPYFFNAKWKYLNTTTYLNFSEILLIVYNAKTSTILSSAEKNKSCINKWMSLEFLYFFNTLCTISSPDYCLITSEGFAYLCDP